MMPWLIMAVLTFAAALAALWPLGRTARASTGGVGDEVSHYQAQLAEIERDVQRGLIGSDEGEALRIESARRLLRAGEKGDAAVDGEAVLGRRRMAAVSVMAIVPLGALLTYSVLGSPHLPSQPLSARTDVQPGKVDVAQAIARIEAHLAAQPGDLKGWDLIAPIYVRSGRFIDAVRAYDTAIANGGASAERWASLGEARMMAASGAVTPEARAAFEEALRLEPAFPKAVYGRAMGRYQDGDVVGAIADINQLVAGAKADAPWLNSMRELLATWQNPPQPAVGAAIAALPTDERNAMIRSMVDGLSRRLADSGGTLDEWQRLIRARMVLGEPDQARLVLAGARQRLAGDKAAMDALSALALELKIGTTP
jgi:cytochrome c-type biogenesis protein CcmH